MIKKMKNTWKHEIQEYSKNLIYYLEQKDIKN